MPRDTKLKMIHAAQEKAKDNVQHGLRDDILDARSKVLISMILRSSVAGAFFVAIST